MNSDKWFYLEKGRSMGPQTEADLAQLLGKKVIALDTMIWSEGIGSWSPLAQVFPALSVQPPPLPTTVESSISDLPSPSQYRLQVSSIDRKESRLYRATEPEKRAWSDINPHPWRRYFARILDNAVNGTFGFIVFSMIASQVFPDFFQKLLAALNDPSNKLLSTLVITMAAIPINAILIGFTSASVGKWIFGVRILDRNSRPIGFVQAIKREVFVWIRGMGLGIPFVALFTASSAYKALNKNGVTSWDRDMNLSVLQRPSGLKQVGLSVVGIAALIVVIAALNAL